MGQNYFEEKSFHCHPNAGGIFPIRWLLMSFMQEKIPQRRTASFLRMTRLAIKLKLNLSHYLCLNKIKGAVGSITGKTNTQPNSHYKRLIRIFDDFSYGNLWIELLQFVFRLLGLKSDYLLLDGTSWEKGGRQFHFLTLCVVYQG